MLFLIIGDSSSLALSLCRAVLDAGHQRVPSFLKPTDDPEAAEGIEPRGGHWIPLEVARPELEGNLQHATTTQGPIDVVINNTSSISGGVFESSALNEPRAETDFDFLGSLRIVNAILPSLRERNSGTIVYITSTELFQPQPVPGIYCVSVFAFDGLSDTLPSQPAPYIVRLLIVAPWRDASAARGECRPIGRSRSLQ